VISIIINPISGGRRGLPPADRAAIARAALMEAGEPGEVSLTRGRGDARTLARDAGERGARLVVAWGGDGTINEVACALAGQPTPLGIVPAGSGNGLAADLGVDRRPAQALAEALRAAPRPIDAGSLGGRMFFNLAGIGFDAHVAACFDREPGGRRGFSTYVRVSARELWRYRSASYRFDASEGLTPAFLIVFANAGQYGNGARIAPAARLDDGLLDLVVFREHTRLSTCYAIPRLFTGGAERVKGWSVRQVKEAVIESDHPMVFHVDGEPVEGGTRLDARVHPAVLRVCVR
jgi:YegS/Rv2252/BmrU family lipid kinase